MFDEIISLEFSVALLAIYQTEATKLGHPGKTCAFIPGVLHVALIDSCSDCHTAVPRAVSSLSCHGRARAQINHSGRTLKRLHHEANAFLYLFAHAALR